MKVAFATLIFSIAAFSQDVSMALLDPVATPTGFDVYYSTQNYFPNSDELRFQLSRSSRFGSSDIIQTVRDETASPVRFTGLPDGVYYVRGWIEYGSNVSPYSNVVSAVVRSGPDPELPAVTLVIRDTGVVTGSVDVLWTRIAGVSYYELQLARNANFNGSRTETYSSNQNSATVDIAGYSGTGSVWVRMRGVWDGPGPWSELATIQYDNSEKMVYVLPTIPRQPWRTDLFFSVPETTLSVHAVAKFTQKNNLPGSGPTLVVVDLDLRSGDFFVLPLEGIYDGMMVFESNVPLNIAAHYSLGESGGVIQVPQYKGVARSYLTGIGGVGQVSAVVIANPGDKDLAVAVNVRVDSTNGFHSSDSVTVLVPAYGRVVRLLSEMVQGSIMDGSVSVGVTGPVAVMGAVFYQNECGIFPSYMHATEQ